MNSFTFKVFLWSSVFQKTVPPPSLSSLVPGIVFFILTVETRIVPEGIKPDPCPGPAESDKVLMEYGQRPPCISIPHGEINGAGWNLSVQASRYMARGIIDTVQNEDEVILKTNPLKVPHLIKKI